ncbi:MAG: hypothetical protein KH127_03980 [Haemophilus parainfluenzae]|jgi:hypothetical protein|nr:hypothetical protein [Haemophilus parainfluenzae]
MRNIIQTALREHLHQHASDKEKMLEYNEQFDLAEKGVSESLRMYADLVFNYGVELDSLQEDINGSMLIGVGSVFRYLCSTLDFAQYGREQTEINLNVLDKKYCE